MQGKLIMKEASFLNQKVPMIKGIVANIFTSNLVVIKNIFKEILQFKVIYENNNSEFVLHNSELSNQLFLHLIKNNNKNEILSNEHLIIFYLNDIDKYKRICELLIKSGISKVLTSNPYWNRNGSCFLIGDVFQIVFCPSSYQSYRARIAAPAADLDAIVKSSQSLGLNKLGEFKDHEKFDGVMLGSQSLIDCHLEFTHDQNEAELHLPDNYSVTLISTDASDVNCLSKNICGHHFEVRNSNDQSEWIKACIAQL